MHEAQTLANDLVSCSYAARIGPAGPPGSHPIKTVRGRFQLRRPQHRHANQTAIARAAGVSVSTVSRALSNAPGISDERRTQIRRLAHEAGYLGRGPAVTATRTLLTYVTASIATGGLAPFYDAIVTALVATAREAGLALGVRLVDEASLDVRRLERDAATETPIATMFVGIDPSPAIATRYLAGAIPLVLVNGYDPEMRFDCVAPNNFFGGALAARHLLEAGHRSLLYVEDHIRWTTIQRRRGFVAALEQWPDARQSVLGIAASPEATLTAEIERRRRGLSDWTAMFCVNDMSAIRAIGALEAAGFHVPADISVLGFDDLPYASMMNPPLSTMTVDTGMIGRQAIALLLRRLAEPDTHAVQIECGVRRKLGGTVAQLTQNSVLQ
jgi:DNA-binding LacI/PurR family transcriptional regulator